jgi:hypothetical protein
MLSSKETSTNPNFIQLLLAAVAAYLQPMKPVNKFVLSCLTAFRHPKGVGRSQNQPVDWHAPSETT